MKNYKPFCEVPPEKKHEILVQEGIIEITEDEETLYFDRMKGLSVVNAFVWAGLVDTKSNVKRLIEQKGLKINGKVVEGDEFVKNLSVLRRGKLYWNIFSFVL